MTGVFAHQGGWDEILLVIGPMAIIAGLLWVVKRRVDRLGPPPSAAPSTGTDPAAPDRAGPADRADATGQPPPER